MANAYGTWTFFKRETKRFMKVWMQTIMAPVINNLLYFAIFGLSIGRAVTEVAGIPYLEFLVPGLIMMGIINNAYQNPSSSIIIMKYQGLITDILMIPLKRFELLLAYVSSAVLRALIIGFMTYLTAIFFVDFTYASIPIIFISVFLVSLFFSFVGVFVGIWATDFDKVAFIMNFIMMPLIFLGGVFYPVSNLSGAFRTLSTFNPIVYMINALRYGFTGVQEFPIGNSLIILSIATVVAGSIVYWLLRKGWRLQN